MALFAGLTVLDGAWEVTARDGYPEQGLYWLAFNDVLDRALLGLWVGGAAGLLGVLPCLALLRGMPRRLWPVLLTSLLLAVAGGLGMALFVDAGSWPALLAGAGSLSPAVLGFALVLLPAAVLKSATRPGLGEWVSWLMVFTLAAAALARPAMAPAPAGPNLLLVSVDTLRADRLGCYGYAPALTPTIDRLASEGTLYETVIAAAPVTLPATATLMTGLDPVHHGVRYNGFYNLDRAHLTLAELLSNGGWDTAAVVSNYALDGRFGIGQGFTVFEDEMTVYRDGTKRAKRGAKGAKGTKGKGDKEASWWTQHLKEHPSQRLADEVTDEALGWLASRDASPFFLWVHYMDPHGPHRPPAGLGDVASPYDGEVTFVDNELARLLAGLPADRPTLIAFVADHGESLGEHGADGHVRHLYEQTLRVPFVLHLPGQIEAGRRVQSPLAGRDVAGEILSAMGLAPSGGPLAPTKPSASWWTVAETWYPHFNKDEAIHACVRDARYKYVDLGADGEQLFDLADDPGELRDLSAERPDALTGWRERLKSVLGERPAESGGAVGELDDESRRVLEELGYLGTDEG